MWHVYIMQNKSDWLANKRSVKGQKGKLARNKKGMREKQMNGKGSYERIVSQGKKKSEKDWHGKKRNVPKKKSVKDLSFKSSKNSARRSKCLRNLSTGESEKFRLA